MRASAPPAVAAIAAGDVQRFHLLVASLRSVCGNNVDLRAGVTANQNGAAGYATRRPARGQIFKTGRKAAVPQD